MKTEDKRKFSRCLTQLDAQYFSEERRGNWETCTVINISRKGMGIKLHASEQMDIGSILHLAILVPKESDPIMVKGELRWVKQKGDRFIGGIELAEALDDVTWARLVQDKA